MNLPFDFISGPRDTFLPGIRCFIQEFKVDHETDLAVMSGFDSLDVVGANGDGGTGEGRRACDGATGGSGRRQVTSDVRHVRSRPRFSGRGCRLLAEQAINFAWRSISPKVAILDIRVSGGAKIGG